METHNAKIESTMLGYEDHGIMTSYLHLKYSGFGQGFGGYCLDDYSDELKERIPTEAAGEWIKEILTVVGVEKWEDLTGKHIRLMVENGRIIKIGNLMEEKWFCPKELFEKKKKK